jgi:hypothetical protein
MRDLRAAEKALADQASVLGGGPLGDGAPREELDGVLASRLAEARGELEVKQHSKTHLTAAARWVWQGRPNISMRGAQWLGAGVGNGFAD